MQLHNYIRHNFQNYFPQIFFKKKTIKSVISTTVSPKTQFEKFKENLFF